MRKPLVCALAVALVVSGCSKEKRIASADDLQQQLTTAAQRDGYDKVAQVTVSTSSDNASAIFVQGGKLIERGSLTGDGSVQTIDNRALGARTPSELPLQAVLDGVESMRSACTGTPGVGLSQAQVAPTGAVTVSQSCSRGDSSTPLRAQTLDGKPVKDLPDLSSVESLTTVFGEYRTTVGNKDLARIELRYGSGVTGAEERRFLFSTPQTAGCTPAMSRSEKIQDNSGIWFPCSDTGTQRPFSLDDLTPGKVADALKRAFRKVPEEDVSYAEIQRGDDGKLRLQVWSTSGGFTAIELE